MTVKSSHDVVEGLKQIRGPMTDLINGGHFDDDARVDDAEAWFTSLAQDAIAELTQLRHECTQNLAEIERLREQLAEIVQVALVARDSIAELDATVTTYREALERVRDYEVPLFVGSEVSGWIKNIATNALKTGDSKKNVYDPGKTDTEE